MANILQVTNPALNTETRNIGNNPALNNPLAGQEIKNPVDPSRVTRADGRDNGQNDGMAGDKGFGVAWLYIIVLKSERFQTHTGQHL